MISVPLICIHFGEHRIHHLCQGCFSSVTVHLGVSGKMDRVLSLEGFHESALVHLRVDSDRNREQSLDHFKLHSIVSVLGTAANRLDYRVDKQTGPFAVHLGRGLALFILAVIWAFTSEEIVAEKLLDAIKKLLDKAWQFRLDRHLKYVKVLVGTGFLLIRFGCHLFYNTNFVNMALILLTKSLAAQCNQFFVLALA